MIRSIRVGRWLDRVARRVGFRSAPGYKTIISPALRDEIRLNYAEENDLLRERLRFSRTGEAGQPE